MAVAQRRVFSSWVFQDDSCDLGELRNTEAESCRDLIYKLWKIQSIFVQEFERLPGFNGRGHLQYDVEPAEFEDGSTLFLQNNINNYVSRRTNCFRADRSQAQNFRCYIAEFKPDIEGLLENHTLQSLMVRFGVTDDPHLCWGTKALSCPPAA